MRSGGQDPRIYTPADVGVLQGTEYSWNFTTQPDPNGLNRSIDLAQGHCLGGGSSINFMQYCRGAASVFDEWADISGQEGLRFDNLLEQFRIASKLTLPSTINYAEVANISVYGDGPVQVSFDPVELEYVEPLWSEAMSSAVNQPSPLIDVNDGSGIGYIIGGPRAINLKNGTRSSAQLSYGASILGRSNVNIITNAVATKINFSGIQAVSVDYVSANTTYTISATRDIIVTAGAFGTPKLLMLSGVGPKDHLDSLGIPIVLDVPELGSNLRDHHCAVIMSQIPEDIPTSWTLATNATQAAAAAAQYQTNGTGPLSSLMTSTFVNERPSNDLLDSLNATFQKSLPADRPLLLYQYLTAPYVPNPLGVNVISGFVALVQPEGSGVVRLASSNYLDDPLITLPYWGTPADLALQLYGYKTLRAAMASAILSPVVIEELFPGAEVTTDEELVQAMYSSAFSFHHPAGTAALGTVVDGEFRVKGLRGLRVVGSAVFPVIPTCHLQAGVYAVGELAAKVILEGKEQVEELVRC